MVEEDRSLEGMVTLQERMVHLINQLSMPVVEVGLVLNKMLKGMTTSLQEHADEQGGAYSDEVMKPWPIDEEGEDSESSFTVDKVLDIIDEQRMDILETLIRVTLVEQDSNLVDGVLSLRPWERLVRQQLAKVKSPGQLFSPLDIPEDW